MQNPMIVGLSVSAFLLLCVTVINITPYAKGYNKGVAFFFGFYNSDSYEMLNKHWALAIRFLSIRYVAGILMLITMLLLLHNNSNGVIWIGIAFIFYIQVSKRLAINRISSL